MDNGTLMHMSLDRGIGTWIDKTSQSELEFSLAFSSSFLFCDLDTGGCCREEGASFCRKLGGHGIRAHQPGVSCLSGPQCLRTLTLIAFKMELCTLQFLLSHNYSLLSDFRHLPTSPHFIEGYYDHDP